MEQLVFEGLRMRTAFLALVITQSISYSNASPPAGRQLWNFFRIISLPPNAGHTVEVHWNKK